MTAVAIPGQGVLIPDSGLQAQDSRRGTALFDVRGASFAYHGLGRVAALAGVTLAIHRGEYVALLGPNGAGKSTLLRLLAGVLVPHSGTTWLDGEPLARHSRRRLAQRIALLPQRLQLAFDAYVEDVVQLGRTPHSPPLAAFRGPTARDRQAVEAALVATDTARFRRRLVQELSGGEQQRVALALALAQEAEVLLLDEPTSHLDPAQAQAMLDLLGAARRERGLTVVSVFHDLNLAALHAERLLVLHQGRLIADGPPAEILRPEVLEPAFGPALRFVPHPDYGVPQVVPRRAGCTGVPAEGMGQAMAESL